MGWEFDTKTNGMHFYTMLDTTSGVGFDLFYSHDRTFRVSPYEFYLDGSVPFITIPDSQMSIEQVLELCELPKK